MLCTITSHTNMHRQTPQKWFHPNPRCGMSHLSERLGASAKEGERMFAARASEPETEGCLQRGDVCCTHEMCLCQQFPFLHSMAPTLTRSLCLTNQLSRSLPPPPVLICSLASSLPPRFLLCNTELLLVNANNVVLNMTSSV